MSDESNETPNDDDATGAYFQAATDDADVTEEASDEVGDEATESEGEDADPTAADDGDEAEEPGDGADESDDESADDPDAAAKAKADRKAKADAAVASRTVERRTVTSRRVTPKGGTKAEPVTTSSKARDAKKTANVVSRTTAPVHQQAYSKGPSPWWVPAIMFGLLIVGALIIMTNYMGAFGDASNVRLVIGLGFILGGIITATQYR